MNEQYTAEAGSIKSPADLIPIFKELDYLYLPFKIEGIGPSPIFAFSNHYGLLGVIAYDPQGNTSMTVITNEHRPQPDAVTELLLKLPMFQKVEQK